MSKKEENNKDEKIMSLPNIMKVTKVACTLGKIFSMMAIVVVLLAGIIVSYDIFTAEVSTFVDNELLFEFVSTINHYGIEATKEVLVSSSRGEIFVFEVLFPALVIIATMSYLYVLCNEAIDFIKDINNDKALFTKEKLSGFKKLRISIYLLLILLLFDFDFSNLFLYAIIAILIEMMAYLYERCVKFYNKSK